MSDDETEADIVLQLDALATYAERANHWTDDKRLMDAAGVADTIYGAIERIEELEERLKAATDDAKEAEAYAEELEDRNKHLCDAVYIDDLTVTMQASDRSQAIAAIGRALDLLGANMLVEAKTTLRTTLAELKGEKPNDPA